MAFFKKGRKELEYAEAQRETAVKYKKCFASDEGKFVLMDLMNKNFILNSHKGDMLSEGRRQAVLDILFLCNIDIKQLDAMLKGENNE